MFRSPDSLQNQVSGLVHFDTQRAPNGIDLTVDSIFRPVGPGQLDFGGSEFVSSPREGLSPKLETPDDEYGWWELSEGAYILQYNEAVTVPEGQHACVYPLERTLRAGAHHGAFFLDDGRDPLETLLMVGPAGCRLKENCRLSRLVLLE